MMKLLVLAFGLLAASPAALGQISQGSSYGYSSGISSPVASGVVRTVATGQGTTGQAPKVHEIHTTSEREVSHNPASCMLIFDFIANIRRGKLLDLSLSLGDPRRRV